MSSADKANQKPIAAFVGIDWADQKHDIALRALSSQAKLEHHRIESQPEALADWVLELRERFGSRGKILICLEQSRGALIHFLMGYDCFELYPINPKQLDNYRKAFHPSGAKDDPPMRSYSVSLSVYIMSNCTPGGPTMSRPAS